MRRRNHRPIGWPRLSRKESVVPPEDAVLTSREKRFWWAKRYRNPEPPHLFRLLARGWRPQLPPHLQALGRNARRAVAKKTTTPVWNPWLWIK